MAIFKRILIILSILFLVLAGFAVFALKSGFFTVDARDYVISLIKQNTGKDVRIGTIELGLYNNIVVHDVSMPVAMTFAEKGEFASIGSIIIRFNLLDIISRKKDFNSTLSSIIIDKPLIYLKKENGVFNLVDFASSFTVPVPSAQKKGAVPLPINKVFIQKGKVVFDDRDNTFTSYVDNFSGTILLKENPMLLRVNLSGKTKDSQKKNFMLDLDYYIGNSRFRGNIKISDALLNDWGAYILQPKDFTINSGGFYLDAAASGTGLKPEQMKIYGYAGVKEGGILIKNRIPVTDIDGSLEINSDRVRIRKAFFTVYGGKGVVKGSASSILGAMKFSAKAGITGINLGEFDPQNLTGTAQVYANAWGSKDSQQADLSIAISEGMVRGMPAKGIAFKASLKDSIVRLDEVKGLIGSGSLTGGGTIDLKKGKNNYNLLLNADGLDAQKLSGAKEISGSVTVALKCTGPLDKPKITAEMKSVKIKYSGNDMDNFSAKVTADRGRITAGGSMEYKNYRNLSLNSVINITGDKITIGDFKLQNNKELLVDAKGSLMISDGALGVSVTARDIFLSDLALDFLKGKDIDGAVRGTVYLKGTAEKPLAELDLSMAALKIRGSYYKVTASVRYGDDVVKIIEVNFNDNLKGSGQLSLKKKIFDANFELNSLKGDVISEFTGIKIFDSGQIDGNILVRKEASGYGGNVNLTTTYSKGTYKSARVDIAGSNNVFSIKQFDITQKKGYFKSGGSFSVKNDSDIRAMLNGRLENFRINDKLEADAVFAHTLDLFIGDDQASSTSSNSFKASKISFNGKAQDDLDISVKTFGKSVPELKVKWGEGYLADASLNAEPEIPQIEAVIQLRDADLYRVYTLLNSREKPLAKESLVTGEFNITGPVNKAKFAGTLSQTQGITSGEGFVGLEKKKGIYVLSNFGIKYNAVNVNLKNFMNIFDEKFGDTGVINGQGEIKGRPEKIESAGSINLSSGKLAGMPYDSVTADYTYMDKKVALEKGLFAYKDTSLRLDGSTFEIKGENDYYATITAQMKDFNLANYKLNGNLNFYGRILNNKKLKITGSLGSDNFMFRKHRFNPFVLNVNYGDDVLNLKTSKGKNSLNADLVINKDSLTFRRFTSVEEDGNLMLNVAGSVQFKKDTDSDVLIAVKDVNPQMANDLLGWDHTWGGKGNGNVKISGNAEKGLGITVFVTLSNGMVDGVDFDIVTGVVVIKDDAVNLSPVDNLMLTKADKYEISVGGIIPVPLSPGAAERLMGQEMNLNVKMKAGDMSVFKFLKFIDDASGPVDLDLNIKGTKEYPTVSGRLNITGGILKLKYLFKELTNVYANVLIKNNVIDIYTLKADTERGTIKVENLDEKKGGIMKFMKPYEVNWKITNVGDKVRFTDTATIDFISGDADLDLAMTGLLDSPNVKGTMHFENAKIVYPIKVRNKAGEQTDLKDNYAKKINWDIYVSGGENVHYYSNYYNNFADLTMKFTEGAPLRIYDKGNDMKMYGSVGVARGVYKYMNTELKMDDMKQSRVSFDNERTANLDIYAKAALRRFALNKTMGEQIISKSETTDLTIYVRFSGKVGKVNLDLTSDPRLDRDRLLYILTFGKDQDKNLSQADAVKYLDAIANSWLRSTVSSIVPADIASVDLKVKNIVPVASGATRTAEDTTDIEVGIGRTIGDNWWIEYRPSLVDVTDKMNLQHTLGAEMSIDSTSKFVFEGILKDPDTNSNQSVEGRASYKVSVPFGSWGEKATPTPTAVVTPGSR